MEINHSTLETSSGVSTPAVEVHQGALYSDLVVEALTRYGSRTAFISHSGESISYSEAAEQVSRFRHVLGGRGIGRGSGVGALGTNAPNMWLIQAASYTLGARFTGLHALGAVEEHARLIADANIGLLLVDREHAELGRQIIVKSGEHTLLLVDGPSAFGEDINELAREASVGTLVSDPVEPDDVAWLQYTGGTTGQPKGVMLTQQSMAQQVQSWLCSYGLPECPRYLAAAPITHAAVLPILPTLICGGTVILQEAFSPQTFFNVIEKYSVNYAFAVPTMLSALRDSGLHEDYDLSSLKCLAYGAAPISPSRLADLVNVLGPILMQGYAQTEAGGFMMTLRREEHDPVRRPHLLHSCGRPAVGVVAAILDEDNKRLGDDQIGEICIRSAGVMRGYWKQSEATTQALSGGWLHTGDIGRRDSDGYYYIVDRAKDMIITGGFNVYSREVEDVLTTHLSVANAAVIGRPHSKWGEEVTAYVVLQPQSTTTAEELMTFVRERKGVHYAPKSIHFVTQLPSTAAGKIDKRALRAEHWVDDDRQIN